MIVPILSVSDVDESISFYTEKLGFTKDFSMPGPDGKTGFGSVRLGQAVIMVGTDDDLANVGKGVQFMTYVPEEIDIDAYYAETKARGTEIAEEIKSAYWGDRCFTVHDPDGYRITLSKTVRDVPMEEIEAVMSGAAAR